MTLHHFDAFRHSISTSSTDFSYLDIGQGPVALFVHGLATNAYLWRNVIDAVRAERRCIALDLPLHGQTLARAEQDFGLPALATGLEEFCAALDLTDIDLVANDTGGAICQAFAATHPERLATFTLTNCETHDNLPPASLARTVALAASGQLAPAVVQLLGSIEGARARVFGDLYEHAELLSDEVVRAFLEPLFGTLEHAQAFERMLTSLHASDLLAVEPGLRQLNVPTLIVWGTGDVNFETRWAYWLRETIPGATDVVELPAARLLFPDERAAELVPHLRRHWAGQAQPGGVANARRSAA